jgi:uncharacterized protein YjcR
MPLAEQAEKYDVHPTQIAQWQADLVKGVDAVFDGKKPDKPVYRCARATRHER